MYFKWANTDFVLFFAIFQPKILTEKTVGFSRIRTRIIGVEGERHCHGPIIYYVTTT